MSSEQQQLEAGIQALEAQRVMLGDTVVEVSIAGLRARIAALTSAATAVAPQALKQVSIMFLDIVGSTMLAQRLDPEDIGGVMDGVLSRGTTIVQAHGGRVLQYAGDNLLAAFGADESAEDDAERAVRCGLALLALGKTLGLEVLQAHGHAGLDVRIGVHTGGVLLGGGVDEDGSIRGQAVNIAARMEQTAPAGGLRITHDTYVQVRGLFDVSAPEPLTIKGLGEPLLTHLVLKAKPRSFRIARRGIEGVATRMIGRDAEFEALQDVFKRLCAERRWMAVSIVGEAGLGKSRLLSEFEAWSEDRPERIFLFRGRANPKTLGQPYGLLRDIVAWRFHIGDDDTLDQAKLKIEQGIMPLFADEPEFAQGHAHLLGHLIGLDWKDSPHLRGILDDPNQIRSRGLYAMAQMFRRVGLSDGSKGGSPIILQLEDLHWADDDSLDFLNYLAEVDHDVPLLVLASTRTTLFERRADWRSTENRHQRIELHALNKEFSRQLANELLKKLPEVPSALRELVTGGSEGNPFYMEELVRMLIDQGAIDHSSDPWRLNADRLLATQVPTTLTGVLQSRLDGLPVEERLTLQQASVIGQVFWDKALIALDSRNEATLPRLVQRELVLPRQDTTGDGLREYTFNHAFLHQVTHGTVLRQQRKALHGKLADWLAAQSQGTSARAGGFLGLTALHYAEAGDDAKAAEFHARAAEHAAGRMAHTAALEHVSQALALLDRAGSLAAPADQTSQALLRWRLLKVREQTLDMQGDRERQSTDLDTMERIARELGDDGLSAHAAYRRAFRAMRLADWPACERGAQQAVALADAALAAQEPSEKPQALCELRLLGLRLAGSAMGSLGRLDDARVLLLKTAEEARVQREFKAQVRCLNSLGALAELQDNLLRLSQLNRETLALARQLGDRRGEAISLGNVGANQLDLGDLTAGRRDLEEGLLLIRQNGDRALECGPLCSLSVLALFEGDHTRALDMAHRALETAVEVQARTFEALAALFVGHTEVALNRPIQAKQAYARARKVAQDIGDGIRFDSSAGLARLALSQNDTVGALREAQTLLAEGGLGGEFDGAEHPRWIELTLHRVLAASGEPRSGAWLERAHSRLEATAKAIADVRLQSMFLTNIPHHREIVTLWGRLPQSR